MLSLFVLSANAAASADLMRSGGAEDVNISHAAVHSGWRPNGFAVSQAPAYPWHPATNAVMKTGAEKLLPAKSTKNSSFSIIVTSRKLMPCIAKRSQPVK